MAKKKPTRTAAGRPAAVRPASATAGPMSVDLLEQLVGLMSANDLNTIDLRDGDKRVILRRGASAAASPAGPSSAPPPIAVPGPPAATQTAAHPAPAVTAAAGDDSGTVAIKSPMVGTFYAKPAPDAKPFVSVGTAVGEDTDVCVIEAMKVFNNIKAETKGTITKVLAEDGRPVEFGQVLFLVKP